MPFYKTYSHTRAPSREHHLHQIICTHCHAVRVPEARSRLQQRNKQPIVCMECGDKLAVEARKGWCVAGINKSNPMLITDPETLKQLNPKRTTT